jgi:putative endonuclease
VKPWIEKLLGHTPEAAHLKAGRWGERQAARLLKNKRYRIIGKRVRTGRRDEIDIVAQDRDTLVFVEVKTRRDERFGRPFAAVNAAKRRCLSRAAAAYLKRKSPKPAYIRFDVVEVIGSPEEARPEIRHIENAFPLDSRYRLWW